MKMLNVKTTCIKRCRCTTTCPLCFFSAQLRICIYVCVRANDLESRGVHWKTGLQQVSSVCASVFKGRTNRAHSDKTEQPTQNNFVKTVENFREDSNESKRAWCYCCLLALLLLLACISLLLHSLTAILDDVVRKCLRWRVTWRGTFPVPEHRPVSRC